jgi:hypothetical protein
MRRIIGLLFGLFLSAGASAQTSGNPLVVTTCGTIPGGNYNASSVGSLNYAPFTIDVTGKWCTTGSSGSGVTSFNTRTGAVTLQSSDVTGALGFTPLNPANNLSDVASAATSRTNLGAAASGANSDITSLSGLTTPLSIAQGGTGAAALTALALGSSTATTQSAGDNSNKLATTAYVATAITGVPTTYGYGCNLGSSSLNNPDCTSLIVSGVLETTTQPQLQLLGANIGSPITVGSTANDMMQLGGVGTSGINLDLIRYNNGAGGTTLNLARSRGATWGTAGALQANDAVGSLTFLCDDGSTASTIANNCAAIIVDEQVTATTGITPTFMRFFTETVAGVDTEALRIRDDQSAWTSANTKELWDLGGNLYSVNLTSTGTITATTSGQLVNLSPPGIGTVNINPGQASNINNENIGQTTALAGKFTTLQGTTSVLAPAGATTAPKLEVGAATEGFWALGGTSLTADVNNVDVLQLTTTGVNTPNYITTTSTTTPTMAAGTLALIGSATAPTLGTNGEGFVQTSTTNGVVLGGKGSTNDTTFLNDAGATVCDIPTGGSIFYCLSLGVFGTTIPGTGIYRPSTTILGLASNGTEGASLDASQNFEILHGLTVGSLTSSAPTNGIYSTGILQSASGIIRAIRVVTASGAVTVATTDDIVVVNKTTGAATTANLPASPATGVQFCIKDGKGDANTNNITITPAAGNIDGSANDVINTAYGAACLVYNGTQYNVLASNSGLL